MRAHSPGLQPSQSFSRTLLFPFCPDCGLGHRPSGWLLGTSEPHSSVLDFLKTSVVLSVTVRGGVSCPGGWTGRLRWRGGLLPAVAAVSASPCPFRSALPSSLPLELISSAFKKRGLCGGILFCGHNQVQLAPAASSRRVIKAGKRCLETLSVCFKFALCLRNKTVKQITLKMTALREIRFS